MFGEVGKLVVTDAPYVTEEIRELIEDYSERDYKKGGYRVHVLPVRIIERVQELAEREVGLK